MQNGLYAGTSGYVDREASKLRATHEASSGKLSERQQRVLRYLERAGKEGLIWRELAEATGMHHGQISSVLSVLHRRGLVFALRIMRDNCHPYVYFGYVDNYEASERTDEPTETASGKRRRALEAVLEAAIDVIRFDGTDRVSLDVLRDAVFRMGE